jgi:signal transduction histidine kinase
VVDAAVAMVLPQAGAKNVEIVERFECAMGTRYIGDADRVLQIILNVLSNSVKFTGDGGRVTIQTKAHDGRPDFDDSSANRAWIMVRISDTGVGIPEADVEKIFQPFVQLNYGKERKLEGTGLGLTISRQLARLMGGDLCVERSRTTGACFTLWLPR